MSLRRSIDDVPTPVGMGVGTALRVVRDALRGRPSAFSRSDAIELLAGSRFPNRHRDLQVVLEDDAAPARLRYLAATALARCDRDAAREILTRATVATDALVLTGVMRALGQVGDVWALDAIERALPRLEGRARAQAEFARLLLVHRHGLTGRGLPEPPPTEAIDLPPDCSQRILIRPARGPSVERSLTALGDRPYGIELAEDPMFEFQCDRCSGMIMLNVEFTGRDALSTLQKQPALFGIGALRDDTEDDYSAAAVMLATPVAGGERIRVAIHLTSGDLVFAGTADIRAGVARWSLHAVRRLGAFPVRAEGTFADGRLSIDLAASGTRVVHRARPTEITAGRPPRVVQLRPAPGAE